MVQGLACIVCPSVVPIDAVTVKGLGREGAGVWVCVTVSVCVFVFVCVCVESTKEWMSNPCRRTKCP